MEPQDGRVSKSFEYAAVGLAVPPFMRLDPHALTKNIEDILQTKKNWELEETEFIYGIRWMMKYEELSRILNHEKVPLG